MPSRFFVLGAPDAEMDLIERILTDANQPFTHARAADGARLRPGGVADFSTTFNAIPPNGLQFKEEVVLVEVAAGSSDADTAFRAAWTEATGIPVAIVDHHDTEQASYPPARALEAASCAQVWKLLHPNAAMPREVVLEAAADHCLGAAFAGEVPGVTAEELLPHVARTRAGLMGVSPEAAPAALELAVNTLRAAKPHPNFAALGLDVGNLTQLAQERGCGWSQPNVNREQYPQDFPGGPIAGAMLGRAYLIRILAGDEQCFRGGGGGDAMKAAQLWADGLCETLDCYGVSEPKPKNSYAFPARGIFGGTIRPEAQLVWGPDSYWTGVYRRGC